MWLAKACASQDCLFVKHEKLRFKLRYRSLEVMTHVDLLLPVLCHSVFWWLSKKLFASIWGDWCCIRELSSQTNSKLTCTHFHSFSSYFLTEINVEHGVVKMWSLWMYFFLLSNYCTTTFSGAAIKQHSESFFFCFFGAFLIKASIQLHFLHLILIDVAF